MARALWKGLVNFGLVNIPVELHTGVRDIGRDSGCFTERTSRQSARSGSARRTVSPSPGTISVKGYEIERGRFVTVTEDDFKTAALERSRSIDISSS